MGGGEQGGGEQIWRSRLVWDSAVGRRKVVGSVEWLAGDWSGIQKGVAVEKETCIAEAK